MNFRQVYKNNKTMMYRIIYKDNLVNINAKVDNNNNIIVTAPKNIDIKFIDNFILNNFEKFYNFIEKRKLNSLINLNQNIIHIHGVRYELVVQIISSSKQKYEIIGNKIYLFLKTEDNKQKMVEKIFFDIGHEYIIKLAKTNAKKYGFKVNEFDTKWYKNKWGQCEPKKQKITFAIQLIMFNDEIINYVIIHELCHLVHANHSNEFWKLVESYYPQYRWAREKLKFQV